MVLIPIGGVFVFGNGINPMAGLIAAIFNVLMGGLALAFGLLYGLLFLQIIGYIIGGLGLLMLLVRLISLLSNPKKQEN